MNSESYQINKVIIFHLTVDYGDIVACNNLSKFVIRVQLNNYDLYATLIRMHQCSRSSLFLIKFFNDSSDL